MVAATVDTDNTSLEVHAIGTVAAARAVTLYPQVTGVVTEIDFAPGTKVEAGATLIKLDDGDQQVAVDRAKIAVDSAQAALDRAQQLAKSNNITSVALTDAQSAVQKAGIDLKSAQLDLAKRTVKAPFGGTIGLTDITVGDLVSSSKAIATLDDMSTVTVAFDVPERASGRIAVGQDVTATTEALAGQRFQGAISAVDSRVDPVARTLRVEATLPNDANVLKPGMALAIDMSFPGEDHPAVPSLAVQWDRRGLVRVEARRQRGSPRQRRHRRPAKRHRHRRRRASAGRFSHFGRRPAPARGRAASTWSTAAPPAVRRRHPTPGPRRRSTARARKARTVRGGRVRTGRSRRRDRRRPGVDAAATPRRPRSG